MASGKVRVAVLGLGRVSSGHLRGWLDCPLAEIAAICDARPEAIEQAQRQFGLDGVFTTTNFSEAIARDDVDAVDICLPDYLHRPAVLEAAEAGKHILCEKPLGQTAEQAEEMLAAAEQAGVVHAMRLQRRHSPVMHFVRELIQRGELGEIRHFRMRLSVHRIADPSVKLEWRLTDEYGTYGALGDLGSHSVDLAFFLLGPMAGDIVQVAGLGAIFIPIRELEDGTGHGQVTGWDACSFTVRYAKNVLATFEVSRFSPGEDFWQVDGQEASVRGRGFAAKQVDWYERRPQEHQRPGSQWQPREVPEEYFQRPDEWTAFCQAVLEGKPMSPNFEDGLRINIALDRIQQALLQGGTGAAAGA